MAFQPMKEQTDISVLMPVFNAEKYLKESIDSILDQTYKNFRFLIINDGSDDNSESIILSYTDPRIIYIKNENNSGVVKTLNRGIEMIDTEYIVRMDADDIAVKDRLEIQRNFMDCHPEIGVSSGYIRLFGKANDIWKLPLADDDIKATLLFGSPICHPAVIIRSSVLKKHKLFYRFTYPHMEDYDLWYRLKDHTIFANIDRILVNYRFEGQNITTKYRNTLFDRLKEFYKIILNDLGIEANDEELLLHYGFGKGKLSPNPDSLIKYHKWLKNLIAKNNRFKVYQKKSLEVLLNQKWDQLFYLLPPYGLKTLFSYWWISKKLHYKQLIYLTKFTINNFLKRTTF